MKLTGTRQSDSLSRSGISKKGGALQNGSFLSKTYGAEQPNPVMNYGSLYALLSQHELKVN